ncbi:MAG TPA: Rieske 2Fe-2S domain-containing protein [Nitrososphaeraceae archaeon]|jgi:nitrite reductase/ring-hydroxylating ferredoxin subunit|nr:Rieske 2Fe-2S domain-containing protein [Nitrososphaeraceae archaeon]
MTQNQDYVEAGKVSEISNGHMKHVEINGKEIAIANLDGKFYAFADRCGHMNARLSRGNINQNVVTCPFHAAKFDITSGKKMGEPVLETPPGMEPLPASWQKYMGNVGQEMSFIKTYDQETYQVKVEGDRIKIKA